MSKAFTLLELLAVVGIIAALAAISYPVFVRVKMQSLETVSASNLHQIHIATAMYQDQNDGSGSYGDSTAMGLPPSPQPEHLDILYELKPPRAPHLLSPMIGQLYVPMYIEDKMDGLSPSWKEYSLREQERSVLYIDPFNNDSNISLEVGKHITRRFLAVDISGALIRKSGKGDWQLRSWWFTDHS